VVLILDGASCHKLEPDKIMEEISFEEETETRMMKYNANLLDLYILFLPPRATTMIQPLDQEIIHSWKRKAASHRSFWQFKRYKDGEDPSLEKSTIHDTLEWVTEARMKVKPAIILRSWGKADILPSENSVPHLPLTIDEQAEKADEENWLSQAQEIMGQPVEQRLSLEDIVNCKWFNCF